MTAGTSLPDPRVSLEEARALRSFIVDLTIRVCRERTVNYFPEDFPGGGPDGMTSPGQEGKVVAVLAEELKKMGVRYTTHAKVPGRDCLLATVGKLYGRGVLDDKGPLVAAFAALRILNTHADRIQGAFTFGAVGDEEVGVGVGLPYLIEQGLIHCTDAVIPDIAGNMKEINVAEKGRVLLKVKTRGKQAHAMEPAKGVNAINAMARFLVALQNVRLRYRAHPVLGGPTINVGLVRGGVAPNAVPADCETTLDIRYVPGQTAEGSRQEIQVIAGESIWGPGEVAAAAFSVEILQDAKPCEVSPDAPIVKRIRRHAPDARVVGSGGGTVAKDLVLIGVDAVGWSQGDEATYHQPNEEIEVEQLVTFAGRLANLALEIANEKQA